MLYFYTSVFLRESKPVYHFSVPNIPVYLDLYIQLPSTNCFYRHFSIMTVL